MKNRLLKELMQQIQSYYLGAQLCALTNLSSR